MAVVEKTVDIIGDDAFCDIILKKTIPDDCPVDFYDDITTSFRSTVFQSMARVQSIRFSKLKSIGNSAMESVPTLKTIDLEKCTSIGSNSFSGCIALEEVNLPLLTSADASAFRISIGKENYLTSIELPELRSVPAYLFAYRTALETVIIPKASTLLNKLIFAKKDVLDTLLDTLRGDVQKENLLQIEQIDRKLELNAERRRTLTTLMTRGYLEPAIYAQENNDITSEADALTAEKDRLVKDVTGSLHQADSLNDLIHYAGRSEPSTNFDGALFEQFIDRVTIRTRTEIVFHLKCGLNLTERIGEG